MILLFGALAWLIGLIAAALGAEWLWPVVVVTAASAAGVLVVRQRLREVIAVMALVMVALAGAWRFEASKTPAHPGDVALLVGEKNVSLRGFVVEEPEQRERSQGLVLEVSAYRAGAGWLPTDGRVLVTTRPFPRFDYGDVVELRGTLDLPPAVDGFDYGAYLARRGIGAVTSFPTLRRTGTDGGVAWRRSLNGLRHSFDAAISRSMPEPEGALARGILLGTRDSIPSDLTDEMNRAGISHLIAISGYNVTLVAAFVVSMLAWLIGRRPAIVAAMLLVPLFTVFVGGGASVLRAAVMGEVMLGASLAGRPGSALSSVVFTGALLSAIQPSIIQDVSFQLSFAATLGIVLGAKPIADRLEAALMPVAPPIAAPIAESVAVTMSASLAVLPIMAATFGRVSFVALVPANLAAVWAFPLMMLGAAATAITGVISQPAGRLVGDVAYVPLWYLVKVARLASSLPYASLSVDGVSVLTAAVAYGVLGLLGVAVLRRRPVIAEPPAETPASFRLRLRPGVATALVMLLAAGWLGWSGLADAAPSRLTATVLDVGQGDATLIQTPSGLRVLIDGGPSGDRLLQALAREMPASAHRIDLVVLSDGRDEHAGGLVAVAQRYDIGGVLTTPQPGTGAAYRELVGVLQSKGVAVSETSAGQWLDLGDGAHLEVLSPGIESSKDAQPLALRLVQGNTSLLLAGAIDPGVARSLSQSTLDLRSTALVMPRHGADAPSPDALVAAVSPRLAIVSVGDNPFGLPSPSAELALNGLPMLRTDRNGSIRLRFDPGGLGVDYERGPVRQVEAASK